MQVINNNSNNNNNNNKGETESTIMAAQDQEITTNYFKNKIFKEEIGTKRRLCEQHEETIDQITSE
jgi:hypothetical protein